jgi:hypothetical protein
MTQHLEVLELLSFRHCQGTICLESVLANGGRANKSRTGRAKNSARPSFVSFDRWFAPVLSRGAVRFGQQTVSDHVIE